MLLVLSNDHKFLAVSIDTDSRCQLSATNWLLTPTHHVISMYALAVSSVVRGGKDDVLREHGL